MLYSCVKKEKEEKEKKKKKKNEKKLPLATTIGIKVIKTATEHKLITQTYRW